MSRSVTRLLLVLLALATPGPLPVLAEPYRVPSAALASIVDAPGPATFSRSPDRQRFLVLGRPSALTLADLAAPELRLAGTRFDPAARHPSRSLLADSLELRSAETGEATPIRGLPEPLRVLDHAWSPDGSRVILALRVGDRLEPWLLAVQSGRARRLGDRALHALLGEPHAWLDATTLLVRLVPEDLPPAPTPPAVPTAIAAQEHEGGRAPARTYTDLLRDAHDADLFEHHATAELATLDFAGVVTPLGIRGMISTFLPSPDGKHVYVETLQRPFSYTLPLGRFPVTLSVHGRDGSLRRVIAELPLAEDRTVAFGSVRAGPRLVQWRADADAELSWFDALDGGDPEREAGKRDAWVTLPAPFVGDPLVRLKLETRGATVRFGDSTRALVTESWRPTRRTRTWLVNPSDTAAEPVLVEDRLAEDRYADPGNPVLDRNAHGRLGLVLGPTGNTFYRSGDGAGPEGDVPFLDEVPLAGGEARRLWTSTPGRLESFVAFLDAPHVILIRRETPTEPTHHVRLDLRTGEEVRLTRFEDPHPDLSAARRELIRYPRADGVMLTGTLLLPPGYDPARDGPRPTLLWAYPREFLTEEAASQVRASPHRFVRVAPSGALPFLRLGYVVLDDPAMPIVAREGGLPNDTFVEQLVASAQAAVDALAGRGVTDPSRVAIGGHSYGAFMAANLVAHSRIFRAAIARSGAYNRTLTPFGFQGERRTYWRAAETYDAMSPFRFADRFRAPVLLLHGELDENSGTFPIQSERLYQALKGLGKEARYVPLPLEGHSYRARETQLHVLAEQEAWLARHLGVPGSTPPPPSP